MRVSPRTTVEIPKATPAEPEKAAAAPKGQEKAAEPAAAKAQEPVEAAEPAVVKDQEQFGAPPAAKGQEKAQALEALAVKGRAPMTSAGGRAPMTSASGREPMLNSPGAAGRAPMTSAGGRAPMSSFGGRAPMSSFGGRGPMSSFGGGKGHGNINHINQLHPKGADKDYVNGLFNCGPAVVAMLARSQGKMGHLNDADLIQQLGQGVVTNEGTTPEGIAKMMERADVPLAGKALGAGYTDDEAKGHLLQGHKLIAQVRSSNPQAQKDSAHYVVVEGMTRDGNYVISDPLAKGPYTVSPNTLKEAVLKAPPDGGMLIPVSSAQEAAEGKGTKATEALMGPTTNPALLAHRGGDTLEFPMPNLAARPGQLPVEGGQAVTEGGQGFVQPGLLPGQGGQAAVQTGAPATGAPLIINNPAVAKVSEKEAFTATDEVLAGVNTEFKETSGKPTDAAIVQNEQRNTFNLDVKYSQGEGVGSFLKRAVTAAVENVGEFIQNLFNLKARGDERAYETLSKLESSHFEEDKKVLKEFKKSDKKDPGTGVRTRPDSF